MESHSVSLDEIARIAGIDGEIDMTFFEGDGFPKLAYRRLKEEEHQSISEKVLRELDKNLPRSGDNESSRWDEGWGEILVRARSEGVSEAALRPQYFNDDTIRLFGDYARVENPSFEYDFYRAVRILLFQRYLSEFEAIVDFGCGTGTSLVLLGQLFPDVTLFGCDWARPSQELMVMIARHYGFNLTGIGFNMLTAEGGSGLPKGEDTAFITMHSLEQLGSRFQPLLDYILNSKPGLCLHVEPIDDLYDAGNSFDEFALRYHQKRNYLHGFLGALKKLEKEKRADLLDVRRLGLGGLFHEGYSLVVWRPI